MKIYRIAQINDIYDAYEAVNQQYSNILNEFHSIKRRKNMSLPNMSWEVIPFARLKKIWKDYAKTGIVRDTAGMEYIKSKMMEILARLQAANDIAGHSAGVTNEDIEEATGFKMPDGRDFDFYFNFIQTKYGTPVSDFGLDKLWAIAKVLMNESSP